MKTFAEIYDSMKDTLEYQVEELSLAFTESVLLRMEEMDDLSGAELAERMGASNPYISKLLKGKSNFTLETLVKLARALDCRIAPPQLIPNKPATTQGVHFERRPKAIERRPKAVVVAFRQRPVPDTAPVVSTNDDYNQYSRIYAIS